MENAFVLPALNAEFWSNDSLTETQKSARKVLEGRTTLIVEFEVYREVDGVKLPFARRWSRPGFTFTHKFDEIKHNVPIDDASFEKPKS